MTGPKLGQKLGAFQGREEHFAKKLNPLWLKQLNFGGSFLLRQEAFIKQLLKHYACKDDGTKAGDMGKVVDAVARLLAGAGKMTIRAASLLAETDQKKQALRKAFSDKERDEIWKGVEEDFYTIERKYRKKLTEAEAFGGALPEPLHRKTLKEGEGTGLPAKEVEAKDESQGSGSQVSVSLSLIHI